MLTILYNQLKKRLIVIENNPKEVYSIIGCGFIGKALLRNLLNKGIQVNILDRNKCPEELVGIVNWIQGDFSDKKNLEQVLEGAAVAFHLISSTVPGDQNSNMAQELNENVVSTINFINIAIQKKVKRVVFASSASVYGIQQYLPINEGALPNPISSHGIIKLTIEKYLQLYEFLHGIEIKILRIANPYGPEQDIYGRQGFIGMTVGNVLKGNPILVRGAGQIIRDYIYIDDVVELMARAAKLDNIPSIINISSGEGLSLNDIISELKYFLGSSLEIKIEDYRKVDIPVSILDRKLSQDFLQFNPLVDIKQGLSIVLSKHGLIK